MENLLISDLKWQLINHLYIGSFLFFLIFSIIIYSYYFLKNLVINENFLVLNGFIKQFGFSLLRQIFMFAIFYVFDMRPIWLYTVAFGIIVLIQFPNVKRMKHFGLFFFFIYSFTFTQRFNCLFYVAVLDALIVSGMKNIGIDTTVFYFNKTQKNTLQEIYNNLCQLASLITSSLNLKAKNLLMKLWFLTIRIWDWVAFLYYRAKWLWGTIMPLMSLKTLVQKLRSQKEKELKKKRAIKKQMKLQKEKKEEVIVKYEI